MAHGPLPMGAATCPGGCPHRCSMPGAQTGRLGAVSAAARPGAWAWRSRRPVPASYHPVAQPRLADGARTLTARLGRERTLHVLGGNTGHAWAAFPHLLRQDGRSLAMHDGWREALREAGQRWHAQRQPALQRLHAPRPHRQRVDRVGRWHGEGQPLCRRSSWPPRTPRCGAFLPHRPPHGTPLRGSVGHTHGDGMEHAA